MPDADEKWMREALALARRGEGRTRPNPPVGAIVVHRDGVVARGYHRRAGGMHAEAAALRAAGTGARGGTLYVTLEPCCTHGRTPPCTDQIVAAGVARVCVCLPDPNPHHRGRGLRLLRRQGVDVVVGVCRAEGQRLIEPFAKWVQTGVPYVTLKLGTTLDGRIADAAGRSKWITSPASRRRVDALRGRVDAVLVGARTARLDDPSLQCKRRRGGALTRVIVDARGSLPFNARVLTDGFAERTILATSAACPASRRKRYAAAGARVWTLGAGPRVPLPQLLRELGKLGLLHVVCEGGGQLAASLVRQSLVDAYAWFLAPCILGDAAVPAVGGTGWTLRNGPRLVFDEVSRVGPDVLITARPACPVQRGTRSRGK